MCSRKYVASGFLGLEKGLLRCTEVFCSVAAPLFAANFHFLRKENVHFFDSVSLRRVLVKGIVATSNNYCYYSPTRISLTQSDPGCFALKRTTIYCLLHYNIMQYKCSFHCVGEFYVGESGKACIICICRI